jgi:methyl-accepting chemotaxis protein
MAVQRWTDEMLDELASSVGEMRESMTEIRKSMTEIRDSVDGLRATAQALLQVAAQNQRRMDLFEEEMELTKQRHAEEIELMKQRQAENDQRFNVLLEEVRYLIRGNQRD